jgi:hypothetical protein
MAAVPWAYERRHPGGRHANRAERASAEAVPLVKNARKVFVDRLQVLAVALELQNKPAHAPGSENSPPLVKEDNPKSGVMRLVGRDRLELSTKGL